MIIFFLLIIIIIIAMLFIGRKFFYSAKRSLFKDQAAWSGKDITIKYNSNREVAESGESDNFLKMIAEESKTYLDDESQEEK